MHLKTIQDTRMLECDGESPIERHIINLWYLIYVVVTVM